MFNRQYENRLMQYFESMQAYNKIAVINLGGISGPSGGSGGPPGGIIGQLAQIYVTYDTTEAETDYTPPSGRSLLDNLNHIRYRIGNIEDLFPITDITNLNIGTSPNLTCFNSAGHQTMSGTARPWRDEMGELLIKSKNGTRITNDLTNGLVDFSDTCQIADDWIIINIQLNHDKDLQSALHPHLHFKQTASGVPNWLLAYRWQTNGETTASGWLYDIYQDVVFEYSGGELNQIAYFSAINPPGNAGLSDIVQIKLFRDTDNDSTLFSGSDPVSGDAGATMFDVHFQINSLGSDNEYTK